MESSSSRLNGLLPVMQRLDALLELAVKAAELVYGAKTTADAFRGLYISSGDIAKSLDREPGAPLFQIDRDASQAPQSDPDDGSSRIAWLARIYGLSSFDVDVLLIALAPELDLRYERLYAYLQDDVTRRRPTVDLALNLCCRKAAEKFLRRSRFAPDAPLIHHQLLQLLPDPHHHHPPLLSHYLKVDEQIIRFILDAPGLDPRLRSFCKNVQTTLNLADIPLREGTRQALLTLVLPARETRRSLRLYFQGAQGIGKGSTAKALANEVGASLLVADLKKALAADLDFKSGLKLLFREAWFQDALLYLTGLDAILRDPGGTFLQNLQEVLAKDGGVTILAGTAHWITLNSELTDVITVPFRMPDVVQRRTFWQRSLTQKGLRLEAPVLDALAGLFRHTPAQIAEAVNTACNYARWNGASLDVENEAALNNGSPTRNDFFAAARAQSGLDLATLAVKIAPHYTWDDIVLPDDALAQLSEICQRVIHREKVLGEWGFGRKLSAGKGVTALFSGPSGTGKTMAAEVIANELGLDLYRIDLAGVVSKYIGETEKNLNQIFRAAESANAILFFDEADALFGKRSEVRDSHDRYANIEISYLLQKMEQYEGIAILATNLRGNLDAAFVRRLAFTVHFPFPNEASRKRIWERIWPAQVALEEDIEFGGLSRELKMSGGNIKNIALAAAFFAADGNHVVTQGHLQQAVRREYQKMGKNLSAPEQSLSERSKVVKIQ